MTGPPGGDRRWRAGARVLAIVVAVTAAACSAPPDPAVDDGGAVAAPIAPEPPRPVAAPTFACPDGASARALEGGASVCDPWAGARPRCGPSERLAAGGCLPIAPGCVEGWPADVGDDARFVRAGATGGDGTRDRPFGSILEALGGGARTIALAPGEHALPSVRGVTIVGSCPGATTLRVDRVASLSDATLRRVRITGGGMLAAGAGTVELDRVEVDHMDRAIEVRGALVVRGASFRDVGEAIIAFDPESVSIEDSSFERGREALWLGDVARPRARVSLARVVFAELEGAASGGAVLLGGVAEAALDRVVVETAAGHGLLVRSWDTTVRDVVLRDVRGAPLSIEAPQGGDDDGDDDAREALAVLERAWIARAGAGVALGAGRHHVRDLVVEEVADVGLVAIGARGQLERVAIARARVLGVDVLGGELEIADLHVDGVEATSDQDGGAMVVEEGARVTLERALLEHADRFGVATQVDGDLTATDLEVRAITGPAGGYGAIAHAGGRLTLSRASLHDLRTVALFVYDATAAAEDLSIARVDTGVGGADGTGIAVVRFAGDPREPALTLARAEVVDTVRWSVIVSGSGARLDATDLVTGTTRAAPCGASTCVDTAGGAGIVGHGGARLAITSFAAREAEHAGVLLTADVDATLERGIVERNAIGLVTSPRLPVNTGATPGLAFRDVIFAENLQRFGQTDAEVPPPSVAF